MFYRYMTFEHSFYRKAHVLFIGQSFSVFCIILTLKEKKLFATTQTCTNKYAVEKSIFVFFAKFNLVIFSLGLSAVKFVCILYLHRLEIWWENRTRTPCDRWQWQSAVQSNYERIALRLTKPSKCQPHIERVPTLVLQKEKIKIQSALRKYLSSGKRSNF